MRRQAKLNFKINEPTRQTRAIYTEEIIREALDKKLARDNLMISLATMDLNVVEFMKVVGICHRYTIQENEVIFDITIFSKHEHMFKDVDIILTTRGQGVIDRDGNVSNYNLIALDIAEETYKSPKDFLSLEDFEI